MFSFSKIYKYILVFSSVVIVLAITALAVWKLNLGIDFRGGSLLELNFQQKPDIQKVATDVTSAGYGNVVVQPGEGNNILIKTQALNSQDDRLKLVDLLKKNFGEFEEVRFDSVGPVIGAELRQKAFVQITLVNLGILLYIAYAFRKVGRTRGGRAVSPWRLSWAAIIALIHDLLVVLGVFAVLGHFWHVEVDSLFITALLTVLGFSVHDTIVVFDRLRENLQRDLGTSFADTLNYSINQTLVRSINTSVTVLFVLLALALFGGSTTLYFVIALLVGVTAGTYSSIFVASGLLLLWNRE